MNERWHYLAAMAACAASTLPLEWLPGVRVWRQPRRLAATLGLVLPPFIAWDILAINQGHWWFSEDRTTGWRVPGGVPVEELVFFVVIPICGLLTHAAVGALWPSLDRHNDGHSAAAGAAGRERAGKQVVRDG